MNSLEESISTKASSSNPSSSLTSILKNETNNNNTKNSALGSATASVSSLFTTKSADEIPATPTATSFPGIDFKTILIIVLIIVVVLSYLGINLLNVFGDGLQSIINITSPVVMKLFAAIGYTTGEAINVTADVAADTVKTGTELAEGAVQNVGNMLIDASQEADPTYELKKSMEPRKTNSSKNKQNEPQADTTEGTIQKSISSGKQSWCLVGEHENRRGCIAISDGDKCLSGQVFPNQQMCLNPTLTP